MEGREFKNSCCKIGEKTEKVKEVERDPQLQNSSLICKFLPTGRPRGRHISFTKGPTMRGVLPFVTALILAGSHAATALPRFALVAGAKCGSCHSNPTGGQMRTEYGTAFSSEKLPLAELRDSDFTFNPKLTDNITIGGDYRSQFVYDGLSKSTTFQAMSTTIYGAANIGKKLLLYFKQDIVNGTYSGPGGLNAGLYNGTEVYGLAKILPGGGYIKGGSFLPDYGWRIDDHTAYTRGGDLGFTGAGYHPGLLFVPNYKDIGVEAGVYIENLFVTAGLFNGTGQQQPIDFSKYKAWVAKVEYSGGLASLNYRIGASGYGYREFTMGGFNAGVGTGDLALLGEIDWTKNYLVGPANPGGNSMAAFAEIDYRAIQGLWLTGRFDMEDPVQGVSDDESAPATNSVKRMTLGVEFFPFSFVEIRPQYRIVIETPSVSNDVAFVQMHLWF
jgi:hypothetical protein